MRLTFGVGVTAICGGSLGACGQGPVRLDHATARIPPAARADAATKQAVLQVWENDLTANLGYSQTGPPPGFAAAMLSTAKSSLLPEGEFFPKLVEFERGNYLRNNTARLSIFWLNGVRGPQSYSLGHPQVTMTTPTTAIVASCITTAGWSNPSTPPPPGFAWPIGNTYGLYWRISQVDASWYVTDISIPGPKC